MYLLVSKNLWVELLNYMPKMCLMNCIINVFDELPQKEEKLIYASNLQIQENKEEPPSMESNMSNTES